jgi:hypothetical protein
LIFYGAAKSLRPKRQSLLVNQNQRLHINCAASTARQPAPLTSIHFGHRKQMAKARKYLVADISPVEQAWLSGIWLLGDNPLTQNNPAGAMDALTLMSGIGAKALWKAHGNPETHFWRPGMDQPITREDLEHHEACWLDSGEGDNDPYGGDSYFVHTFFNEAEKQTLWNTHGDKEQFHWELVLRRPIPIGASVDAAMVAFTTTGPFNIA